MRRLMHIFLRLSHRLAPPHSSPLHLRPLTRKSCSVLGSASISALVISNLVDILCVRLEEL